MVWQWLSLGLGLIYGPTHDLRIGLEQTDQGFYGPGLFKVITLKTIAFQSHFFVSRLIKGI